MEKKSLGYFLIILGFIFLIIALITIWSMFFNFQPFSGIYILLSIPLLAFSIFTIFFGFYLVFGQRIGMKTKGLLLIIDGTVPLLASIIALLDPRLEIVHIERLLILLPLLLVGIFLIIYGIFLVTAENIIQSLKVKKRTNQILGLISIVLGIAIIASFILLVITSLGQPYFLSLFWVLIGGILIYFGAHLIIKKVEAHK